MLDDKEFIPSTAQYGLWVRNPKFTGNKFELHKPYPVKILCPLHGIKKYMKSKEMYVERAIDNHLHLIYGKNGPICFSEAIEGVHFELKSSLPYP